MARSIEATALSGGITLVVRQFLGIVLSLVGMLVTTRLLGPHKYGYFVIVSGLTGYAINIGKLGLDVYLIRYQGDLGQQQVGVTQGLYLIFGLLFAGIILVCGPVVAWWYKDAMLCTLFWSYAVITPVALMAFIPIALLDRKLDYKHAAMTELSGQLLYVAISVSIVWFTRSVWGVIAGILGQAVITLILATHWSGMRFRPCWNFSETKAQARYGFGYSASMWIWQARDLVNPLLVGRILGAEATAYIAMAVRLASMVGFAKSAVWRVYMSYLARLADDRARMKEAIETGLSHQVLITGISFIAFMAIAPDLIQGLMGPKWLPILGVFPFIAAGLIINSGFSLYSSALYIIGKNHDVSAFHSLHLILFGVSAGVLLRKLGSIAGYGWAEIAACGSYLFLHYAFKRRLFAIKETLMIVNLLVILAGIGTSLLLLNQPTWVRIAPAALFLLVILFGLPWNRAASFAMYTMARQRIKMSLFKTAPCADGRTGG